MRQSLRWLVGAVARWAWSVVVWSAALVGRSLGVLRRSGLWIVGSALLASFFAGLAHFTVYLGPWGAGTILFLGLGAAAAVGRGRQLGAGRLAAMGLAIVLTALPALGAVLVGARLADVHGEAQYLAGWALFVGVTFLGTSALVPLLEAAPRLALGSDVRAALAASLVAAGRRGLSRTLLVGALASALVGLVPVLDVLGPVRLLGPVPPSVASVAVLVVGGGAVIAWSGLITLAGALATEPPAPRGRSRSAFAFVSAALALLVAATLAGATLLPVDHGPLPEPAPLAPQPDVSIERGVLTVRGRDAVVHVPVAPDEGVRRAQRGEDGSLYLIVGDAWADRWALHLDAAGHRLDDGPWDRITAHVGLEATVAFALAALFVLVALRRMRGRARLFAAVRRGAESILRGRLRAEHEVSVVGGVARTAGLRLDAEDGTTMVALPPSIAVLGDLAALADGQELELVSPTPIERLGFRRGAASCPDGAALMGPSTERPDELVAGWALAPAASWLAGASLSAILGTVLMLGGAAWARAWIAPGAAEVAAMPAAGASMVDGTTAARLARLSSSRLRDELHIRSATDVMMSPSLLESLRESLRAQTAPALVVSLGVQPSLVLDLVGFRDGDRVVAVAGVPVSSSRELDAVLAASEGSRVLGVRIVRGGATVDLTFWAQDRFD